MKTNTLINQKSLLIFVVTLLIGILLSSATYAQFTDIGAGLKDVKYSGVAWGDYDNDGDLDILLTGYTGNSEISKVYRNDNGVSPTSAQT